MMLSSVLLTLALALLAGGELPTDDPAAEAHGPRLERSLRDIYDCGSDADCGEEEYCRYDKGECGGDGYCKVLPDVCGLRYRPVCGCNGITYSNACEAASEGVSIAYDGDC